MPRTTAAAVKEIIEVDETISTDLVPFIEAATMLVDRVVAVAVDESGNVYYTAPQLEVIERWLAAHFYAVRDPRVVTEGAGSVMVRYESHVELNLNNTRYGQQAMLLDTAGGLAKLNRDMLKGKQKVSLHWGGTEDAF